MKIQNLAIIGLAITVLVFGIVTAKVGRFFYAKYNENVLYFNQQNKQALSRIATTEESLKNLTIAIEGLNSRLANYDKAFLSVKEKIDSMDVQRKEVVGKVDLIGREFGEWQKHYTSVLKELNDWADNVRVNIETMKKDMSRKSIEEVRKVDLGKIICGDSE